GAVPVWLSASGPSPPPSRHRGRRPAICPAGTATLHATAARPLQAANPAGQAAVALGVHPARRVAGKAAIAAGAGLLMIGVAAFWPQIPPPDRLGAPRRGAAARKLRCLLHPLHIGRHRFLGERSERLIERQHGLAVLAEAADRDRALGGFFTADHEQRRHLCERVLAPLVIDLLVAQVVLDA